MDQHNDSPLKIWERIDIVTSDDKGRGQYISRVEEFNSEGIVITKPDWVEGGSALTYNSNVYVQFKKADAMYSFSAKMRSYQDEADDLVQLYSLGEIERLQRRQYYRIDYTLHIEYAIINEIPNADKDYEWQLTRTFNISAGGFLMKAVDDIKEGDRLLIKIRNYRTLGVSRFMLAICRRITNKNNTVFAGIELITADKIHKHFSSVELNTLPVKVKTFNTNMQNELVRFIMDEQIRVRRNEMIL